MQKILVFQQNRSGMSKIEGIKRFGGNRFEIKTFDIDESLPIRTADEISWTEIAQDFGSSTGRIKGLIAGLFGL